ncbi:MAG: DUF255 domain-containing protein [Sulfurovum sp.]|nr:DUF255 domain-containing protein [Sulfurovum sp.]
MCLYPKERYTNALIHESSPYLRQHAHNPVNWYPWGKEALQKAKREKKLIFLSIGYSTCHWCHVMEKESFTDEAIAKLLNAHFVSIKVDREEYPQLDKKYQRIYMHLHGRRGGWPLSVFLSPEGEVVDIRTYIPKEEGYGSEGLMNLLPALAALQEHPDRLIQRIETNKKRMASTQVQSTQQAVTVTGAVKEMRKSITVSFDSSNGGFSHAPKFPEASKIDWLLTYYRLYQDTKALEMATYTLTQMAHRGIYDQIGGGFFRYATDSAWQYPHFEKMLYTNAQMISVYANAYMLTGDRVYKKVVEETIAAMRRRYVRNGLFVSASDADSDGEEGGYDLSTLFGTKNQADSPN